MLLLIANIGFDTLAPDPIEEVQIATSKIIVEWRHLDVDGWVYLCCDGVGSILAFMVRGYVLIWKNYLIQCVLHSSLFSFDAIVRI